MIADQIKKVLIDVTRIKNPQVEFSSNEKFGDYSSNIALKNKDLNIDEIVEKISKACHSVVNNLDLPFTAEKVGRFINFKLNNDILIGNLMQIDSQKEDYGKSKIGKKKTVIVDYSAPNIAKPFGIGHLRSTVIGQAIYNLYKYLGYTVIGDNHLGDWGTQFGKLLYMIDKTKTNDLSIENLEKMYVEFHTLAKDNPKLEASAREWFKKLEDNDTKARTIWKQCINISLNEFQRIYDLLGVKIDEAYGESFYEEEMKEMLKNPDIIKYLEIGENNSRIVKLPNIKTPLMFLKSDGGTTYATRDLATLQFRQNKFKPNIVIYEVGIEQKLHFEQVFASAKLLKLIDDDCELIHTAHGLYLAPDGKKFSTRKGKTIKLEEVLTEAIDRARKLGQKEDQPAYAEATARQVGIGAIKYFDLMHSVQSNVIFDWEKIMNMEGNSGPYIQYTIARCNSVVEKNHKIKKSKNQNNLKIKNLELKINNPLSGEEENLLRKLAQFQEVIVIAAKTYSPNVLCNYLYELASKFNTFYNKYRILDSEEEKLILRLRLTSATAQVLKNGLKLLGIGSPEKM